MPTDDYSSAVSGGLKLKGVGSSSKITKAHKKKKHLTPGSTAPSSEKHKEEAPAPSKSPDAGEDLEEKVDPSKKIDGDARDALQEDTSLSPRTGKTEAELRHEERRRKRLDERMKREGIKTHKERVEDLNRYLSKLSEHHDMPRIGPG